jgi:type II secretory pathway component PulC
MDYGLWTNLCLADEEEPPLSYYGIIEQRNLFRPKKELVADKEKKDSKDEKTIYRGKLVKATDLVLTGVVKIRGNYKAILEKKTGGKSFYIKVNDTVQGYTVKDIRDDRIILQKDNQEFMLSIEKRNSDDTTRTQDKPKGGTEQDKVSSQPAQFKYEENIMQKMRMGIGGNNANN